MTSTQSTKEKIQLVCDAQDLESCQTFADFSGMNAMEATEVVKMLSEVDPSSADRFYRVLCEVSEIDLLYDFSEIAKIGIRADSAEIRKSSLTMLDMYDAKSLLKTAANLAKNDPDKDVRLTAIRILGKFVIEIEQETIPRKEAEPVLTFLRSWQNESDEDIALAVMVSLAPLSEKENCQKIREALKKGEQKYLIAACSAIRNSMDTIWQEDIINLLDHPNTSVQSAAIHAAVGTHCSPAKIKLFEKLAEFEEQEPEILETVIWALSELGGKYTREMLIALIDALPEDTELEDYIEAAIENVDLIDSTIDMADAYFDDAEMNAVFGTLEERWTEEEEAAIEDCYQALSEKTIRSYQTDDEDEDDDGEDYSRFRIIEDIENDDIEDADSQQ